MPKRQPLTDGSGRWFYPATSERFAESQTHDGRNFISDATGSQWEHQELYRTAGRRWILRSWSQWQGSRESWEEVDNPAAAAWLVANGHEHRAVAAEIAALEVL